MISYEVLKLTLLVKYAVEELSWIPVSMAHDGVTFAVNRKITEKKLRSIEEDVTVFLSESSKKLYNKPSPVKGKILGTAP